jgi:hypothetical protein
VLREGVCAKQPSGFDERGEDNTMQLLRILSHGNPIRLVDWVGLDADDANCLRQCRWPAPFGMLQEAAVAALVCLSQSLPPRHFCVYRFYQNVHGEYITFEVEQDERDISRPFATLAVEGSIRCGPACYKVTIRNHNPRP